MSNADVRPPGHNVRPRHLIVLGTGVALVLALLILNKIDEESRATVAVTDAAASDTAAPVLLGAHGAGSLHGSPPAPTSAADSARGFRGRVLDHLGQGVASARIILVHQGACVGARARVISRIQGDLDGRFGPVKSSEPLEVDHAYLCVSAPGRARESHLLRDLIVDDGEHLVVLEEGRSLRGRVIQPSGDPISGARVQVRGSSAPATGWLNAEGAWPPRVSQDFCDVLTNEMGEFVAHGLTGLDYVVRAAKSGYGADGASSASTRATVGSSEEVELTLIPTYELALRAVDSVTGKSIPMAAYRVMIQQGHPWRSAVRDPGVLGWSGDLQDVLTQGVFGGVARVAFFLEKPEQGQKAVALRVTAPGYESRHLKLHPTALGPSGSNAPEDPLVIELKPAADLVDVHLDFGWEEGAARPSGLFNLSLLKEGARAQRFHVIAMVDGRLHRPLRLDAGEWRLQMHGSGGSTRQWEKPFGVDKRGRPVVPRIQVDGRLSRMTFKLRLVGGGVIVAPRSQVSGGLSQYVFMGRGPFEDYPRPQRHEKDEVEGFVYWMDPGGRSVSIAHPGFDLATVRLDVPADGGIVVASPLMQSSMR